MGCYVEVENKEDWLETNGQEAEMYLGWENIPSSSFLVCLIDNVFFKAAGVAYSEKELEAFLAPWDNRPKRWFLVEQNKLEDVSSIKDYLGEK